MAATAGTGHVLHVDDEPEFAELVATFLERKDDRLAGRTAESATEGLEVLADNEGDCIVSDYDMPGRNGIEFLDVVRDRAPAPSSSAAGCPTV
jgi:CheY-like chemotaxis protein